MKFVFLEKISVLEPAFVKKQAFFKSVFLKESEDISVMILNIGYFL